MKQHRFGTDLSGKFIGICELRVTPSVFNQLGKVRLWHDLMPPCHVPRFISRTIRFPCKRM
jgi:hypothetical protein